MFADNNLRTAAYYYRPSRIALDAPQQIAPFAGLGQVTAQNPSGKTWQDFLPRDWFESSVYRNILDMLNTLEVARKNLYNGALGQFINTRMVGGGYQMFIADAENGGVAAPPGCAQYAALYGPQPHGSHGYKAFWGWANQFTPAGQGTVSTYIYQKIFLGTGRTPEYVKDSGHVQNVLRAAGYQSDRIGGNVGIVCSLGPRNQIEAHNLRVKSGLGYSQADIVNLVRSLDWEYNRVHLPLPFNLRQWATRYNELSLDNTGIGWAQRVIQLRDLKKWIVIMREKTRQAIDASNLAIKVAEQSLRDENARIIRETEAARIERERVRAAEIEAERVAAQKMLEEERKRLQEEMQAMIAAEKEAALKAAQEEIRTIQDQQAVAPAGTVQPPVAVPAPEPIPAEEFEPPTIITPPPTIVPEAFPAQVPVTAAQPPNALPLILAGAAAFFMFS